MDSSYLHIRPGARESPEMAGNPHDGLFLSTFRRRKAIARPAGVLVIVPGYIHPAFSVLIMLI
jgi:hypothetical protein